MSSPDLSVLNAAFDFGSAIAASLSCPSGYVLSGSTCILSDARAAQPDGKKDIKRTGTGHAPYPGDDKPRNGVDAAVGTTTNTNDTVSASGKNSAGMPTKISVQSTADGGSKITETTQQTDANGSTYTLNKVTIVNPSGVVTGVSSSTQAQQLVYNPTTGQYDTTAAPANTANPAATSTSFPSDYARQGEATQAAGQVAGAVNALGGKLDAVGTKLDDVKSAVTNTTADRPSDPELPTFDHGFGTTFQGLLSWSLPVHQSQCPIGSFTWEGRTFVFDAHCDLWSQHADTLSGASAVLWTLAALFIILAA